MEVNIYEMIEGAKKARGLTVVIDVFRAFSLECFLFHQGAEKIYPIGQLDTAFAMKKEHPEFVLFGERKGARVEGCEFGNSPSAVAGVDFAGKTILHTTSAGTQGIVNASGADEIITGSLVNADAVVQYIRQRDPAEVSLCAMGKAGLASAREDVICAEYIRSRLLSLPYDIEGQISSLRQNGGEHFFNPETQDVFPEEDFRLCTQLSIFPFVIRSRKAEENLRINERYDCG